MKEKKTRKLLQILIYAFCAALVIIGIYQIATYGWQSLQDEQSAEDLAEQVVNRPAASGDDETEEEETIPESIDFETLWEQNKDVVAWLYLPDTVVNYPIVYSGDNDTYLRADLDHNYSRGGTLFVEEDNAGDFSDWNTIIYGHNMKNGSMFKSVIMYEDPEFYEEHPVMYLYTPDQRYELVVMAGCVVDADDDIYDALSYSDGTKAVVDKIFKNSTFSSGETYDENDKLITLSTCSYKYDDARYVLVCKMVKF